MPFHNIYVISSQGGRVTAVGRDVIASVAFTQHSECNKGAIEAKHTGYVNETETSWSGIFKAGSSNFPVTQLCHGTV